MARILRRNTKRQFTARGRFITGEVGIRLAGEAVCCARQVQASGEKSRHIFVSRCTPSQKSVTPFALGRSCILFPAGLWSKLTSLAVLALGSGSLIPCGALRSRPPSYCLGAPLSRLAPPATPHASRGALTRTKQVRWMESESPASGCYPTTSQPSRELLRLFVRSGGTGYFISQMGSRAIPLLIPAYP